MPDFFYQFCLDVLGWKPTEATGDNIAKVLGACRMMFEDFRKKGIVSDQSFTEFITAMQHEQF
jgi:hypothetical protein